MPHTAQIMSKYKLTWKDLTATDFKTYLFAMFKAFIPKKKIKSLDELETFIQTKSAWVTQVTLYNYLKTRMGTRMFFILRMISLWAQLILRNGIFIL